MSSTDIQLYSNNAKTTLLQSLLPTDVSFLVKTGDGSLFPLPSSPNQYFLVTIESAGAIEICRVTSRVGDLFTVVRSQEGTTARSFPAGAQVQMRITKGTLEQFARLTDRLADVSSVDFLPPAMSATGNSFLSQSTDDQGNPVVAVKASDRWRFLTHSTVALNGIIFSSTPTSLSFLTPSAMEVYTGRFIVNFTSGVLAGQSRALISGFYIGGTQILNWSTPTTINPEAGASFELLASNSYYLAKLLSTQDDSLINSIIFGA